MAKTPAPAYTPLNREIDSPLYVQIERDIEISVATSQLNPGDTIPGEIEMARRYGVSRVTVAQAIKELVAAGLLYRLQGKGTFVSHHTIERTESNITSFFYEMVESGHKPRAEVATEVCQPDAETAHLLRLEPAELVIITRRLRYVDNEPLAYQINTTRHSLCPGLADEDFSTQSFQYILEMKYNLRLVELEESLTCIAPDKNLADILQIPTTIPVLVATRMLYGAKGMIIGMAKTHYRGDRYNYKIVRNMSSP